MSTILERLEYGFDRNSRRTWRRRSLTTGEDNAYGYDGLSQVVTGNRGNLNQNTTAIGAVPAEAESFDYDPTGNWRGYHVAENGAVVLDQSRVHDKGNRLTQISGDPYSVLLDRAGRMTQVSPDASGDWNESQKIQWDAWGRITEIRRASDDTVLGTYTYDGLTRRTTRTVEGTATHCYYSDQWRPLEERRDSETSAALQYYWGARHRDDLVRRDRATTDGSLLDEARYVLMDYFSPAAITDSSGSVTERYAFSAFGARRILAPDFSPRSLSECNFTFAFQGQFTDSESGLLNYGYRYYAPHLGRWLSRDPISDLFWDLSQEDIWNVTYSFLTGQSSRYPLANPYRRFDPLNAGDFLGLWEMVKSGPGVQKGNAISGFLHHPGGQFYIKIFPPVTMTFTITCPVDHPYLVTWGLTASPVSPPKYNHDFPSGWGTDGLVVGKIGTYLITVDVPTTNVWVADPAIQNVFVLGYCGDCYYLPFREDPPAPPPGPERIFWVPGFVPGLRYGDPNMLRGFQDSFR